MMSLDLSVKGGVHDSLLWQMEFFVPTPHFPPLESDWASHLHHFVCIIVGRACVHACVHAWVGCYVCAWMGACVRSLVHASVRACVHSRVRSCVHVFRTGFDSVAQGGLKLELLLSLACRLLGS